MPHICKACGTELGDPEEDLHDPDNVMQIVDGGVSNPDSAHLKAKDGPKGPRMFCADTGQTTAIVEGEPGGSGNPPPKENSESAQQEQPQQPQQSRTGSSGGVYKDDTDKSADDILFAVASSPVFELNDEQIGELMSWSDIYDNQIPPQQVEAVLKNFKGVSKQRANLIRQKYEARLNKWIQQTSREDTGPSLGTVNMRGVPVGGSMQQGSPQPQPQRQPPQRPEGDEENTEEQDDEPEGVDAPPEGIDARQRRVARRQEAIDIAAQKFADEAAANFAKDAGRMLTEAREIAITLFKEKAKRDPEWYFEKLEKWDMDLFDSLMSESEAKKKEDQQPQQSYGEQPSVDSELDAALDRMESSTPEETHSQEVRTGVEQTAETPQETQEPETTNPEDIFDDDVLEGDSEEHITDELLDEEPEDSADEFSELMGDVEV